MTLDAKISSLLHFADSGAQVEVLKALVVEVSQSKAAPQASEDLIFIANKILHFEDSHSQTAKALASTLAKSLKSLDRSILQQVGSHMLQVLRDRPLIFDEADYILRDALFDYYIGDEEFSQAAQILGGLNLESIVRPYNLNEKVDIFIKCAGVFSFVYFFHSTFECYFDSIVYTIQRLFWKTTLLLTQKYSLTKHQPSSTRLKNGRCNFATEPHSRESSMQTESSQKRPRGTTNSQPHRNTSTATTYFSFWARQPRAHCWGNRARSAPGSLV